MKPDKLIFFLYFPFLLLIYASIVNANTISSENLSVEESQLQYTLNNKDATIDARKESAQELLRRYSKSSGSELLEIIKNPKEPKILQNHISDLIASSKDSTLIDAMASNALDAYADLYARKALLFCLWKTDSDRASKISRDIALNRYDDETFRFDAIGYFSKDQNNPENIEIASEIFGRAEESVTLRKAAFFYLKSTEDKAVYEKTLIFILKNHSESKAFRLFAIEELQSLKSPRMKDFLIQILFDSKEKTEIRMIALDKLRDYKSEMTEHLKQLRSLRGRLKFGVFKDAVKNLITELEEIKRKQKTPSAQNIPAPN